MLSLASARSRAATAPDVLWSRTVSAAVNGGGEGGGEGGTGIHPTPLLRPLTQATGASPSTDSSSVRTSESSPAMVRSSLLSDASSPNALFTHSTASNSGASNSSPSPPSTCGNATGNAEDAPHAADVQQPRRPHHTSPPRLFDRSLHARGQRLRNDGAIHLLAMWTLRGSPRRTTRAPEAVSHR
jgi:hypothetical protein